MEGTTMSDMRRMMMMFTRPVDSGGGGGDDPTPPTPILPYDAQVEYLESSGTQYINTGIYINGQTTEFRMKYSGFANTYFCCGCRTNYNNTAFVFSNGGGDYTTYNKYFLNYRNGYNVSITCPNDENIHNVAMTNAVVIDGNTVVTFTKGSFTTTRPMWLFASNNQDGLRYGKMRIYECQIYNNGNLAVDFIPVRKEGVGYMYDTISGELFGNSGTGSFTYGNDVTT